MSTARNDPGAWVQFNHLTQMVETRDGTKVAVELTDTAQCLADFLYISIIRREQRIAKATPQGAAGHGR